MVPYRINILFPFVSTYHNDQDQSNYFRHDQEMIWQQLVDWKFLKPLNGWKYYPPMKACTELSKKYSSSWKQSRLIEYLLVSIKKQYKRCFQFFRLLFGMSDIENFNLVNLILKKFLCYNYFEMPTQCRAKLVSQEPTPSLNIYEKSS